MNSPLQHSLHLLAGSMADAKGHNSGDGWDVRGNWDDWGSWDAAESAEIRTLADRPDGTVVRAGRLVAKAHAPDADATTLAARIALAAHPAHQGILLPPVLQPPSSHGALARLPGGRLASVWPYGAPVDPEHPEAAPWEAAGALLARLHTAWPAQLPTPAPTMRGPTKAARALARMRTAEGASVRHTGAAGAVERAWASLPPWCRDEAPAPRAAALCHGDFHLGQLVRHPAPDGPWHLIDVDDLGTGDPAWDLARPASWYATGLLPPSDWERFLGAYAHTWRAAQGGEFGDPWPDLEAPAAALTAQTAALAVAKARAADRALDEAEEGCVDACVRIAALGARPELPAPDGS